MWWEVIPSAAIMTICLGLPQYAAWYFNKAVYGNVSFTLYLIILQLSLYSIPTTINRSKYFDIFFFVLKKLIRYITAI